MGGGWGVQNRFPLSGPGKGIMGKSRAHHRKREKTYFPRELSM